MSLIDSLVARFSRIPGARVGHGPLHPKKPDETSGVRIHAFLESYPTLALDQGYVEFLKKYAGASIENDDFSQIVDILGFSEASTDMEEFDGPIVDSDGFLMVADAVYEANLAGKSDTLEHAFSFDASGTRKFGIYHSLVTRTNLTPHFAHRFDTFQELLADLVERDGWLEPPGRPS